MAIFKNYDGDPIGVPSHKHRIDDTVGNRQLPYIALSSPNLINTINFEPYKASTVTTTIKNGSLGNGSTKVVQLNNVVENTPAEINIQLNAGITTSSKYVLYLEPSNIDANVYTNLTSLKFGTTYPYTEAGNVSYTIKKLSRLNGFAMNVEMYEISFSAVPTSMQFTIQVNPVTYAATFTAFYVMLSKLSYDAAVQMTAVATETDHGFMIKEDKKEIRLLSTEMDDVEVRLKSVLYQGQVGQLITGPELNTKLLTAPYASGTSLSFTKTAIPSANIASAQLVSTPESPVKIYLYNNGTANYISPAANNVDIYANPNANKMFNNCNKLTSIDLSNLNTSNCTDMSYMFYGCTLLTTLDISKMITSKATNLSYMFYNCRMLTALNVSNFNTSSATNLSYMFYNCAKVPLLDVGRFNMSNAVTINHMFAFTDGHTGVLDVSNWDISNATTLEWMFVNNKSPILDVSKWNTSKVKSFKSTFSGCSKVEVLDVSKWNTSSATTMEDMFNMCQSLKSINVSSFDTSKVLNMKNLFRGCKLFTTINISNFNTPVIYSTEGMFANCEALTSIVGLTSLNTVKCTSMGEMFAGCKNLPSIDLGNLRTDKAYSIAEMFSGCSKLTSIDVSKFVTSETRYMYGVFSRCSGLTSINLSSWDTSNVEEFYEMFYGCTGLTSIDLSNFNTQTCNKTYEMFANCTSLTYLTGLDNWNTSLLENAEEMFNACFRLRSLNLSNWDTSLLRNVQAMFYNCQDLIGSITIRNTEYDYSDLMFYGACVNTNMKAKFTVNYIDDATKAKAQELIATKASNSNVVLGTLVS